MGTGSSAEKHERTSRPAIAILGAGNMGTGLAQALALQGNMVRIWDHFAEVMHDIAATRQNRRFLPDILLHSAIEAQRDITACVREADLVIVAMPSAFMGKALVAALPALKKTAILLNVAKGFSSSSHLPVIHDLQKLTPDHEWVHLAGPCIAKEIAQGTEAFLVMASNKLSSAEQVSAWFRGAIFQTTVTSDMIGAALGGILKNVYAILLGCFQKLHHNNQNTEAVVITACIEEMASLVAAVGGERSTIHGLAGLGDLIATGLSPNSHNRKLGEWLAAGQLAQEIERQTGWLPEGALASEKACAMAHNHGVSVPLAAWVHQSIRHSPPTLDGLMSALRGAYVQRSKPL